MPIFNTGPNDTLVIVQGPNQRLSFTFKPRQNQSGVEVFRQVAAALEALSSQLGPEAEVSRSNAAESARRVVRKLLDDEEVGGPFVTTGENPENDAIEAALDAIRDAQEYGDGGSPFEPNLENLMSVLDPGDPADAIFHSRYTDPVLYRYLLNLVRGGGEPDDFGQNGEGGRSVKMLPNGRSRQELPPAAENPAFREFCMKVLERWNRMKS